ncbi:hypothetical protein RclHR1_09920013 [Rhizophagus clarus]|nr:hypothetical protein RclHR1_09920013 [Rhizophagus clarus]
MIERVYIDGKFKDGERSFHIYCTVCDSLVIIRENTIECANDHLNKLSELSDDEINEIYDSIYFRYRKSSECFCSRDSKEIRKSTVYRLINSAKVIQRAWRAFKLRPETWAKRVWNMVRNDGTPDRKKFLGILSTRERKINSQTREEYALFIDENVNNYKRAYSENLAQKYIKEFLAERATGYEKYKYYDPDYWVETKKYQLNKRLNAVAYIVAFIKSYQQGYRLVSCGHWTFMLKYLTDPEYYRTSKDGNNIVVNFVKISEYARYYCKEKRKPYPCDSLEINIFKSNYCLHIPQGGSTIINFSDFNNNCEYVQRVFQVLNSLLK